MNTWLIFTKLTLLGYLAFYSIRADIEPNSSVVLVTLLYFCLNITPHIFRTDTIRRVLFCLSICLSIAAYHMVDPIFSILLPLSIIELADGLVGSPIIQLVLSMIPLLYIMESIQPIYGLVGLLCFMIHTTLSVYHERMLRNEKQMDGMRRKLQSLTRNLNENTEYIRQSEYTIKLEERNRISQEIHDKIGHSMTGALIQMEAAKRLLETDQPKAMELLGNAINISKSGIEDIRQTLKNMKPPVEQIGIHRLKLLIDDFNAKQQVKTVLTHEGDLDHVSPIQWKIIIENVTEALTNARKYSGATLVSVDLNILNKMVRVEVKDNGKGTTAFQKGLGIIGMEERTAVVDGTILIDTTDGFSVTTLLPL